MIDRYHPRRTHVTGGRGFGMAAPSIIADAWSGGGGVGQPAKLYHATTNRSLRILEPRECEAMNGERGRFVFAQPDFTIAHGYALKTPDHMCMHYMPGFPDGSVHACIIRNREKFLSENVTGIIFELPAEQFRRIIFDSGEPAVEWVSEEPVSLDPRKATPVTLESAMAKGIQVFFAPPDADQRLVEAVYDPDWATKDFEQSGYYRAWRQGALVWENDERGLCPFRSLNAHAAGKPVAGTDRGFLPG